MTHPIPCVAMIINFLLGDNSGYPNTHAVLIEHAGCLVYEEYFQGKDKRLGEPLGQVVFDQNVLHDLRSITKSVTSILLGIALAEDFREAVDKSVVEYFSNLKGSFGQGVGRIPLRNILTMTAGIQWNGMSIPYTNPRNDENPTLLRSKPCSYSPLIKRNLNRRILK